MDAIKQMIQYRPKSAEGSSWIHAWVELNIKFVHPEEINFESIEIKIFDTVYTEWSEEFLEAYKKGIIWRKLGD